MQTVELRPMSEAEYAVFIDRSVRDYAEHAREAGTFQAETALQQSRALFESLLPQGVATPAQLLRTAFDPDGTAVGLVWLALPSPERRIGWVYELWVEPAARGKGYGRAIMLAGERELVARGVAELGLNVFGPNATARHLYESLGYQVTAQQMVKPLAR
jgi:ribosomal protein S18 acetylase RimI-like enzyme